MSSIIYPYPKIPGAKASKEEKADFWELKALVKFGDYVSQREIARVLSQELDEINHDGIESEDDLLDENLEETFSELQRRQQFTLNKYPFHFQRYSIKLEENAFFLKNVYLFLLLSNRLNMKTERIQNGLDATLLFEKICAFVAKQYFGEPAESYVFGTANASGFENKVKEMIEKIGEGGSFKNQNPNPATNFKDDKVDVVVWKHFADKRIGKLMGFGQCKTGTTTWRGGRHATKPKDFCSRWFHDQPVLYPIPLLFICDPLTEDYNFYTDQQGFLVFNRFRIMEYLADGLEENLKEQILIWLKGALSNLFGVTYN